MAGTDIAQRSSAGGMTRSNGPRTSIFQDVRIIFRNFAGKEGQYNREGDRNFAMVLDPQIGAQMKDEGWNVKFPKPSQDGDERDPYLPIAVSNKVRPPIIVLISSKGRADVPWDMLEMLDWVDIATVDVKINPYVWNVSGNTGVKAYLASIYITIIEDELELKYADVPQAEGSANFLQYTAHAVDDGYDGDVVEAELIEE